MNKRNKILIIVRLKKLFRTILSFSAKRVSIYGAYYTEFGILGLINFFIPYFISNQESSFNDQSLRYRLISSTACFFLIVFSKIDLGRYFHKQVLPTYWYLTLFITLPFNSTICLLFGYFNTPLIVNSALTMLILALLVDWVSFVILYIGGVALAYIIYILNVDHLIVLHTEKNIYFLVYIYIFSFILAIFFLYQKDKMMLAIRKINEELEDKIHERTIHLKEALEVKSDFLNTISHEIRTPIHGIVGVAGELYEQWNVLDEKERYYLAQIMANSGNRLIDLVSNILDMSKFEFAKMLYNFQEYDVINLIKNIIDEFESQSFKKNIPIILKSEFLKYDIVFDKDRIKQVLRNLLSNALKFSIKGNIIVNVVYNNKLIISVEDQGIGIPSVELEEIFKPFIQSSRTKSQSGSSGLGLSIAAEIIKAHHGEIWAENLNVGSRLSFTLGILEKSNNHVIETDYLEKNSINNFANQKVLFIDDEEPCQVAGKLILKSVGFDVSIAKSGLEALDLLNDRGNFDIIIADLMMPEMDGLELISRIKTIEKFQNVPIILQTGTSEQEVIDLAKSLGAIGYILKPYDKEKMINAIIELLTIHKNSLVKDLTKDI